MQVPVWGHRACAVSRESAESSGNRAERQADLARRPDRDSIGSIWRDGDWGAGLAMIAARNVCDDVVAEAADIAFGDAWVNRMRQTASTNVMVVRSLALADLVARAIQAGRLHLYAVDSALVEETQAAGFW